MAMTMLLEHLDKTVTPSAERDGVVCVVLVIQITGIRIAHVDDLTKIGDWAWYGTVGSDKLKKVSCE
jgi:hypothetical protein